MGEIKNKTFEDKCKLLGNKLLIIKDILDSSFMKELEFEFSSLSAVRSISVDKKLLLFSLYYLAGDDYLFYEFKLSLKEKIRSIAKDYYVSDFAEYFKVKDDQLPQDLLHDEWIGIYKTFEDKCKLLGNTLLKIKDIMESGLREQLLGTSCVSLDKTLLLFSLYYLVDDDYICKLRRRLESSIGLIAYDYYVNFGMTDFGLDNLLDTPTPQALQMQTAAARLDLPNKE